MDAASANTLSRLEAEVSELSSLISRAVKGPILPFNLPAASKSPDDIGSWSMRLEWPLWLASGLVNVPYAAAECNRTFSFGAIRQSGPELGHPKDLILNSRIARRFG
jgi:hypothetical protein